MIPECSKCSRAGLCSDCGECIYHCRCDDAPDDRDVDTCHHGVGFEEYCERCEAEEEDLDEVLDDEPDEDLSEEAVAEFEMERRRDAEEDV